MALGYRPPQVDIDEACLAQMIEHLRGGHSLPPIIVCGEIAFSGSHRLEAWHSEDIEPPTVEISDSDYCDAMRTLGLDPVYDQLNNYDDFCDALRANGVELGNAE